MDLRKCLASFVKQPGGSTSDAQNELSDLGVELPADYWSVLSFANGSEGFLGDQYLRFYSTSQLIPLNRAFCTQEFIPGRFIFGSNGGGEAWAFDLQVRPAVVIKVPFIPMVYKYIHSFGALEHWMTLLARNATEPNQARINPALIGKELHAIHPVVFGGDPVATNNKALLTPTEYAPYVVWWNRKYREIAKV